MRLKKIELNGKTYNLTIDAMLLFECQQELKINLLDKLSALNDLDEVAQAKLISELWPVTALSLARCSDNKFASWQDALTNITLSEMQDLTLELINAFGETNTKN